MIPLLGQGWLYQVQRNRQHYLTQAERRRVGYFVAGITVCIAIILWNCHR